MDHFRTLPVMQVNIRSVIRAENIITLITGHMQLDCFDSRCTLRKKVAIKRY